MPRFSRRGTTRGRIAALALVTLTFITLALRFSSPPKNLRRWRQTKRSGGFCLTRGGNRRLVVGRKRGSSSSGGRSVYHASGRQFRHHYVLLFAGDTFSVSACVVTNWINDNALFFQISQCAIKRSVVAVPVNTIAEEHDCLATLDPADRI